MGIYRWYSAALLVVAISGHVNATTITVAVPKKSVQDLLNAANPVLNENPLGYVQAYDSPFQYQQKPYSAPVQQKIKIPDVAVKSAIKSTLKANAASVAMNAAMAGAIGAVGWVIDTASQPVQLKKPVEQPAAVSVNDYKWRGGFGNAVGTTPKAACEAAGNAWASANAYTFMTATTSYVAENAYDCRVSYMTASNVQQNRDLSRLFREGDGCTKPSYYSSGYASCVTATYAPVQDSDYSAIDNYVDTANSKLKHDLLSAACKGALSPDRCYKSLQDAASFLNSGPSSIQGPTTSSTTTSKNADGTSSISTTTTDTKFKTEYSSDGFTAKPEKTTVTKNPDGSTTETVEKEEDNSTTVQKPGEPEEEGDDPLEKDYTFTDPEMPKVPSFYEQKYPDGLTSVWDDNKARFDNSAFISFMKSFVPSFSGSCPTWGLPMNIMAQASYGYVTFANICYIFDFVKVVIIATAVFTARKIMFGG